MGGSKLATAMRKQTVEAGSGRFVLDHNPGTGRPEIAGVAPFHETNHCASDHVVCADFSQVIVGKWADPLDMIVNPYGDAGIRGAVDVILFQTVDVAVAQREAVAVGE